MGSDPNPDEEYIIKWAAATLYAAGSDTVSILYWHVILAFFWRYHDISSSLFPLALKQTVSAIYSFFIAMQLYPEVQSKAQAEIDAVVGPDRMPMISDRPHLPYIDAMVKEVLRWNAVVPLCKLDSFSRSPNPTSSTLRSSPRCARGRRI